MRLTTVRSGPRGGLEAYCAVCQPVLGEAARAEVVALRKAHFATLTSQDAPGATIDRPDDP